jgi:hypothetical protein
MSVAIVCYAMVQYNYVQLILTIDTYYVAMLVVDVEDSRGPVVYVEVSRLFELVGIPLLFQLQRKMLLRMISFYSYMTHTGNRSVDCVSGTEMEEASSD